ncbi:MAG: S41 family peptidase [Bacteroidota bacterium]
MKFYKLILLAFLFVGITTSCSDDADDIGPTPPVPGERNLVVENFIYRGLNEFYLYKADIPELADSYFASQADKNDFLDNFETPKDLFDNGLKASQDRFSRLIADYIQLENMLGGISTTPGMDYGLSVYPNDNSKVLGYVRYVLPNTSAAENGVERGMVFNRINGEHLTLNNYRDLVASPNLTIGLARIENEGNVVDLDQTISLTQAEYTENPVYIAKTLDVDGEKVGYLMYNSFTRDFDSELNAAFAEFKNEAITNLVLDLRYNGGGSIETATDLASMITGQLEGKVFAKQQWNEKYQKLFEENNPQRLLNLFNNKIWNGENINSLNLNKVYVIATGSSASASELVINGLKAHIDVVHVGTTTVGKFQGSIPIYDAPNFDRESSSLNTTHTYAMLPLVLTLVNANGIGDYTSGLPPDVRVIEYVNEFAPLGDLSEPLLSAALDHISGNRRSYKTEESPFKMISESGAGNLDYQKMYIDKIPDLIKE